MSETAHVLGLHPVDWLTVSLYLLGITLVGWATKSTIRTREDFFMAGRRFGKALMIFHSFGAGTHTDQAVAVSGACYRNGISGIWVQWQWMFTTPFYWLLAPVFRRSRCLTTADVYRDRYGSEAALLFVIVSAVSMTINIGVMLQGTGLVISSMTGGAISQSAAVWIMTLSFIIYGMAGGLVAAVITDLIQGIFIIFLSFLMVPFALWTVGGLEGIRIHASPAALHLVSSHAITIPVIALLSLNAMVGIVAQSQVMASTSAGKTEWEGRVGMTYGNFLKRICTLGWALIGVCAIVMYPDLPSGESERAFGFAVADLLPIGLRGIMLASIMAAVMSSCDVLMVATSALITENVYRNHIRRDREETHYLTVGRVVSFFIVIIALYFSSAFPTVLEGAFTFFQLTASIGISFWMGILWRRMNTVGVFVSFTVATITLYFAKFHMFPTSIFGTAPAIAYQTACFLPAGVISGWLASLLTQPLKTDRIERFFVKIHTPIGQEENLNLPLSEALPPHQRWFDKGGFLIVKPDRQSVVGFLVACAIVLLLVVGAHFLLQL
ncbi:MAG: sodium:solute symporter family protein [Candidatus Omnitrophota bacterium]|jgi:SSS family transporter|nr:MAG: sodium:solute symporter family protein [Candidatus Omnitrophota bacterium]